MISFPSLYDRLSIGLCIKLFIAQYVRTMGIYLWETLFLFCWRKATSTHYFFSTRLCIDMIVCLVSRVYLNILCSRGTRTSFQIRQLLTTTAAGIITTEIFLSIFVISRRRPIHITLPTVEKGFQIIQCVH